MTTINSSLYDTVLEFDPVARIPALRSIAHTALGQSIGFIRNHCVKKPAESEWTIPPKTLSSIQKCYR